MKIIMGVCVKNLYEILNISTSANLVEIKSAYKKMARLYHPDINKSKDAEIQFKLLNNAYSILSNEERRKNYDSLLNAADKKEEKRGNPYDKNSVIKEVKITENEAKEGTTRTVNILNTQKCPKCMGRGFFNSLKCSFCHGAGEKQELKKIDVEISKNAQNGEFIYVGKINSSALYDKKLFLKIIIEPVIKIFYEDGKNIINVDVSLYDAILGTELEINIQNFGLYKIKIPEMSKNQDEIKLDIKEDFFARINVILPKKITQKEKMLFQKLRQITQGKEKCVFEE